MRAMSRVISRFSPGDPYRQEDITDLNRALVATGLVSQVSITPQPGTSDEVVDLDVHLGKAPVHTIAGEVGYGTGEGARVEASWQHRGFFPPEGALTVRGVLGQQEQSVTATVRWGNFGHRDRVLNVSLSAARTSINRLTRQRPPELAAIWSGRPISSSRRTGPGRSARSCGSSDEQRFLWQLARRPGAAPM